jgi:hypothetical protein
MSTGLAGRRVAIVGGCRTPFCKAGAAGAVETLRRLEAAYGPRFTPAPVLVRHAERGTCFYSTN